MEKITVDTQVMSKAGEDLRRMQTQFARIPEVLSGTDRALKWSVSVSQEVHASLTACTEGIRTANKRTLELVSALQNVVALYTAAENQNKGKPEHYETAPKPAEDMPIYDESNGYGGDQGDMERRKNGFRFLWWVIGEDKDLYAYIRTLPGYENYSEVQIHELIKKINSEGCGYVALVNTLFAEFEGTPEEFERRFGFPMYDKDGNYNYNQMLLDLYCRTDDQYYLTEDAGKQALVNRILLEYKDQPEAFERIYGVRYDAPADERANAILSQYNGDVVKMEWNGTTIYEQENRLKAYLNEKGIQADVHVNSCDTLSADQMRAHLNSGTVVKISLGKGTTMVDENGTRVRLGGGHAVICTEVTEDGQYVISSWGKKYTIDPREVCYDPSTKTTKSVINSYLTMDVAYK